MFVRDEYVAITGGAWAGHRGIVAETPEQNEPTAVLVTVERPGVREGICTVAMPMYRQYWVAPQHLAHLGAP